MWTKMPTLKKHVTSNYSRQKNPLRMQTLKEIVKRLKQTKVLDTTFGCFFYRFIVIFKRGESCNSSNEFVKTEKMPFIGRSKPKVKARKTFFPSHRLRDCDIQPHKARKEAKM